MDFEDSLTAIYVRLIQDYPAIEPAGAQQGRVEDVRSVGGREDDHLGAGVEAIHLHQNLVQRLLPLIMTTTQARAAVTAHSVDLIDEDYTRCIALGLIEEIPHTRSPHSHEHLNELAAANGEEGNRRLPRHSPSEQRLARARRPDEQYPARDACAQGDKLFRMLEELHYLLQFLLGLLDTGHIAKGNGRPVAAG